MNGVIQFEPDESEFVEVDPTGRYGRYNEILGKGASKTVYKAFDEYDGIEVAWNQVKLQDFLQNAEDLERLYCEIHLLKTLEHKNIMKLYTSWVDTENRNINFVTEMFTSGTLRQYRLKHKRVNIRALKQWCRQILEGLHYLHSHNPPVIHRDLKCDNVFVNGNQGQVKIGDLGLAAILRKSHAAHIVGTPEFMAPEVYLEEYNELVDIYAFGMCMLEMVVFEYPYSECTHPAQIYKKVISGKKPDALYKVKDPEVREFIEKCLATVSLRLSAKELLDDPFLDIDDSKLVSKETRFEKEQIYVDPLLKEPFEGNTYSGGSNDDYPNEYTLEDQTGQAYDPNDSEQSGINLFDINNYEDVEQPADLNITIKGKQREDGSIFLRIRILDKEGHVRNIYFPFDIETDTALSVATEMVAELDINDQDVIEIANMIDGEIVSLVPEWQPGPGIEEAPRNSNFSFCHNCGSSNTSAESIMNLLMNDMGSSSNFAQCLGNKCTVSHGRFEEITYQIDRSPTHDASDPANNSLAPSSLINGFHHPKVLDKHENCSSGESRYIESGENLDQEISLNEERELKQRKRTLSTTRNNIRSLSSSRSLAAASMLSKDSANREHIQEDLRWLEAMHQKKLSELQDQELGFLPRSSKSVSGTKSTTQKIKNRVSSFRALLPRSSNKSGDSTSKTQKIMKGLSSFRELIPRSSKPRGTASKTQKIMKGISSFRALIPRSSKPRATASKTQKIKKRASSFRALIKSSVRRHKKKSPESSDKLQKEDQETNAIMGSKKARKFRAKKVSAKVKDLLSPRSFRNDKLLLSPHYNDNIITN